MIGGSGFIGNSLIKPLLDSGREVHIVDIKQPLVPNNNIQFHQLNIQDAGELIKLLSEMDEMIYLAHEGFPALHSADPEFEIKANIFYTIQLLRQLNKTNLQKIIYFSSGGAVYGNTDKLKLKETDETTPVSSYGIAKLSVEKYIRIFYKSSGLPIISVRPSNAYGPGQAPFKGQGFIATAIKLAQQQNPITIYGKEGTIRDYLYIDDLVNAIIRLLEYGKIGETYNIGTGIGYSNLSVIKLITEIAQKNNIRLQIKKETERPFDVNYNVLDSNKLKTETGWEPETDLKSGIEKTWKWLADKYNNES